MGYLEIARSLKELLGERGQIATPVVRQLQPVVVMEDVTTGPGSVGEAYGIQAQSPALLAVRSIIEIRNPRGSVLCIDRIHNLSPAAVVLYGMSTIELLGGGSNLISLDSRRQRFLQSMGIGSDTLANVLTGITVPVGSIEPGAFEQGPWVLADPYDPTQGQAFTFVLYGNADNAEIDVALRVRIWPRE